MEAEFRRTPGVIATAVGYTGGASKDPTYEEVCAGKTGHAEAVLVEFDPKKVTYERLLSIFWAFHDSTSPCGPGSQYRSGVFFRSPQQETTAKAAKAKLEAGGKAVVTEITKAGIFWPAEEYHQQFYEKKRIG